MDCFHSISLAPSWRSIRWREVDAHGLEPVGLLHLQQGLVGFLVSVRERSDDGATKDLLLGSHQEILKNAIEKRRKKGRWRRERRKRLVGMILVLISGRIDSVGHGTSCFGSQ